MRTNGVDLVACVAVNDPYVMAAWGEAHKAKGNIRMLADPKGEFGKALDLLFDAKALGGPRFKRFSMLVDDGIVRQLNVEPDNVGLTCSLPKQVLSQLK